MNTRNQRRAAKIQATLGTIGITAGTAFGSPIAITCGLIALTIGAWALITSSNTIRHHWNALTAAHQAHSRLVKLNPFNPKCAHYLRALADAADASRLVRRLYSYSTPQEMRTEADELDPTRSTQ